MSLIRFGAPIAILVAGLGGALGLARMKQAPPSKAKEKLAPLVETVAILPCTEGFRLRVDGEITPFRQVPIAAEISGRVVYKSVDCQAGCYVKQGTVLYRIDPRDADLEIRRIQQLARQADVSIEELDVEKDSNQELIALSKQQLELQQRQVERVISLMKRKAAATADLDTAEQAELTARNALKTLENQQRLLVVRRGRLLRDIDRLAAELERAMLDKERTEIVAPFTGIVINDAVEQDGYVQKGTLLAEIEDTAKMEVSFSLRMNQLRWLWRRSEATDDSGLSAENAFALPPYPVEVELDLDGDSYIWTGTLARYDGAGISAATRTVPCVAMVENPRKVQSPSGGPTTPPSLMRGMFVTVALDVPADVPLYRVPPEALKPSGSLWLYQNEKLAIVPVRVVHSYEDEVFLTTKASEIDADAAAVISPLSVPVHGMRLRSRGEEPVQTAEAASTGARS